MLRSARSCGSRSRPRSWAGQLLLGEQAGLDPLGEVDLLLGGEELGSADAVEVRPDQVGGDAPLVLDRLRLVVEVVRLVHLGVTIEHGLGLVRHEFLGGALGGGEVHGGGLGGAGLACGHRRGHLAPPRLRVSTHDDQVSRWRVKSR